MNNQMNNVPMFPEDEMAMGDNVSEGIPLKILIPIIAGAVIIIGGITAAIIVKVRRKKAEEEDEDETD